MNQKQFDRQTIPITCSDERPTLPVPANKLRSYMEGQATDEAWYDPQPTAKSNDLNIEVTWEGVF